MCSVCVCVCVWYVVCVVCNVCVVSSMWGWGGGRAPHRPSTESLVRVCSRALTWKTYYKTHEIQLSSAPQSQFKELKKKKQTTTNIGCFHPKCSKSWCVITVNHFTSIFEHLPRAGWFGPGDKILSPFLKISLYSYQASTPS